MKIISWNVNGIRAIVDKGLIEFIEKEKPDVICLQEVKAFEDQIPPKLPGIYSFTWHKWDKPWYSWTATLYNVKPLLSRSYFEEIEDFNLEWRVVETEFDSFVLLNIYFPNWWETKSWIDRLSQKLKFYDTFLSYINTLVAKWKSVIATWDYNVCHREIDIARPKENQNSIGFLPQERHKIDNIVNSWFVDVFRYFNPEIKDKYTWWSYRAWARTKNVWWRIDYFFVSQDLIPRIKSISQRDDVLWSDHCPLVLEII